MNRRKQIEHGSKVGLKLTAAERKLILDLTCLDDNYAQVIRDTPTSQPVEFALDDWEDFGGYVAAEANHTEDKKLGKKLDAIFDKIQKILDTYTQGQRTLSSFSGKELHQEVEAPAGHAAFHDVALLARVLLDQAQCQAA